MYMQRISNLHKAYIIMQEVCALRVYKCNTSCVYGIILVSHNRDYIYIAVRPFKFCNILYRRRINL